MSCEWFTWGRRAGERGPWRGAQGLDREDGDPDPEAQSVRIQGTASLGGMLIYV